MSVADTDQIDIIATKPNSDVVMLVIADHLDWSDFDAHAALLKAKINTYVAYVGTGQLAQRDGIPPDAAVTILVVAAHPLTADAAELLAQIRGIVAAMEIELEVEIRAPASPNQA